MKITTVLLTAGSATRFGGNKLLHPLPNGIPIGVASSKALLAAGCKVLAITSRRDTELSGLFRQQGIDVIRCQSRQPGIGSSIAQAVSASCDSDGWIIALADMPYIAPATIVSVDQQLRGGSGIVVPVYDNQRGHPVGFSMDFRDALLRLEGDVGARTVLREHQQRVTYIQRHDPGILIDIDTRNDLRRL